MDLEQNKRALAREFGADMGLKSNACDVAGEVRKLTEGRGADVAFEVVGITPTVKLGVECLRKGGSLTLVGNLSPGPQAD